MLNADFAWLNYDTVFSAESPEATRVFTIDDNPALASRHGTSVAAEGFILVQAEDVGGEGADEGDRSSNQILVNGKHLPAFDLVAGAGWKLWMDRIPLGFLKKGENRVTVRSVNDQFRLANIVVQWRERAA